MTAGWPGGILEKTERKVVQTMKKKRNYVPRWRIQILWVVTIAIFVFAFLAALLKQNLLLFPAMLCFAALFILQVAWMRCPTCGSCLGLWVMSGGVRGDQVRKCPRCGAQIEIR